MRLIHGDCVAEMRHLAAEGVRVHSIVTDPPYGLTSVVKRFGKGDAAPAKSDGATGVYRRASAGFMGQTWDGTGVETDPETWRACYDLLPPGGHLVAFGGTRTWHRIAVAIEDAGFEIRDTLMWVYGSGFPKSHDVSKGIDREAGAERRVVGANPNHRAVSGVGYEGVYAGGNTGSAVITAPGSPEAAAWQGWGTALKPAWEPIILARKPLAGTVATNVLQHACGALNIDGCRVGAEGGTRWVPTGDKGDTGQFGGGIKDGAVADAGKGRWPANVVHDGSDEVEAAFAAFGSDKGAAAAASGPTLRNGNTSVARGKFNGLPEGRDPAFHGDSGSASRFFYCAKASRRDRNEGCEGLEEKPLLWSAGEQNPGSFQAEGTNKASQNNHPTVKPTDLMRWLARMVTPSGGVVLDPFMGSGSTGKAAALEGFRFIGIEQKAEYLEIARRRIAYVAPIDLTALLGAAADARQRLTEALRGE